MDYYYYVLILFAGTIFSLAILKYLKSKIKKNSDKSDSSKGKNNIDFSISLLFLAAIFFVSILPTVEGYTLVLVLKLPICVAALLLFVKLIRNNAYPVRVVFFIIFIALIALLALGARHYAKYIDLLSWVIFSLLLYATPIMHFNGVFGKGAENKEAENVTSETLRRPYQQYLLAISAFILSICYAAFLLNFNYKETIKETGDATLINTLYSDEITEENILIETTCFLDESKKNEKLTLSLDELSKMTTCKYIEKNTSEEIVSDSDMDIPEFVEKVFKNVNDHELTISKIEIIGFTDSKKLSNDIKKEINFDYLTDWSRQLGLNAEGNLKLSANRGYEVFNIFEKKLNLFNKNKVKPKINILLAPERCFKSYKGVNKKTPNPADAADGCIEVGVKYIFKTEKI